MDCGPCAVCGDGKCETPYETCENCPQDCGACKPIGCPEELTCALGCIMLGSTPPMISIQCVGDCVASGCAQANYFFDQTIQCFIDNVGSCGGASLSCLMSKCSSEITACLGKLTCN
jgi:hypothetical protein